MIISWEVITIKFSKLQKEHFLNMKKRKFNLKLQPKPSWNVCNLIVDHYDDKHYYTEYRITECCVSAENLAN